LTAPDCDKTLKYNQNFFRFGAADRGRNKPVYLGRNKSRDTILADRCQNGTAKRPPAAYMLNTFNRRMRGCHEEILDYGHIDYRRHARRAGRRQRHGG
jgi:hypothetical protein